MNFILTLSAADVEIIGRALHELPFKVADPLLTNIKAQATQQITQMQQRANAAASAAPNENQGLITPKVRKPRTPKAAKAA